MPIITLTTDWGAKDHYLASVKGSLLSAIPDINIVDITHEIPPFDIYQTSFVLKNCYKNFPDGTIHLIGVNSDASINTPHTLVYKDNQYFIGADNGIFSLIFDTPADNIIELEIIQDTDKFTFSTRDVFVKAAKHIIENKSIEDLGFTKEKLNQLVSFAPVVENNSNGETVLIGKVVYLDRYENAITNIDEKLFNENGRGRKFTISFNSFSNAIDTINKSYSDVPVSEMLAIFDSNGMLEVAINQGNAGSLLGLNIDSKVRISFDD